MTKLLPPSGPSDLMVMGYLQEKQLCYFPFCLSYKWRSNVDLLLFPLKVGVLMPRGGNSKSWKLSPFEKMVVYPYT